MLELPGYIIEKQIGKGGMARVYLALHVKLDRHVAIKVMAKHLDEDDSNFGERFMSEARIVAKLSQTNIITVFDVGTHDGYHYITMELLPGATLDDKIKQGLTATQSLSILKQSAAALDYAHQKGIIHRDVKPENIMFREDGSAVLTDFGIAKSTTSTNKMTATGTVIGTPHYMSPEQAQGKAIGSFSDIYSLGTVFYEMLTGKVPYDAESSIAVVFKHITESVPELSAEHSKYQMLLNGLMAKDVDARYHSGKDIVADIEQLERDETPDNATKIYKKTEINKAATGLKKPARAATNKKGKVATIAAGVVVILLTSLVAGYFYISDKNETALRIENEKFLTAQAKQQKEEITKADSLLAEKESARNKLIKLRENNRLRREKIAESAKNKIEQERLAQLQSEKQLARNKKIEGMLKQAETDLLNTRLNDAYGKYNEVLRIDSANNFAKNGIQRVADQYLALANNEAIKNNFDEADKYIASVIQIAPTHKNLAMTQQKVFTLKNQQLARQAEEQRIAQENEKKRLLEEQAQNKQNEDEPEKTKKRRSFGGF